MAGQFELTTFMQSGGIQSNAEIAEVVGCSTSDGALSQRTRFLCAIAFALEQEP